jgi:putative hydrolase of the HAD superfamily
LPPEITPVEVPATSPTGRIAAVLFDADGVLQQSADGWRDDVAALCPQSARSAEFVAEVFDLERPCLAGHGDFRAALARLLRQWHSTTDVDEALALWWRITPHAALLDIVRTLRRAGTIVGLASNQHAQRARYMSERLGYAAAFDHLFYSCVLGHAKPDGMYFTRIVQRIGEAPGALLFIDDLHDNVAAARSVGLQAEVFHAREGPEAMMRLLRRHGVWV